MTTKPSPEEIREGLAETFCYQCHECKTSGLSKDDVHPAQTGNGTVHFICEMCWESIPNFQKEENK